MSEIGVAAWSAEGLLPVSAWQRKKLSLSLAQSCLTLCDPMDCRPPGSSVHGIFQARILEWVAMLYSARSQREELHPWQRS